MKFILMVEGQTERDSAANFLKRWLDPQLNQRVGIRVVTFKGYAELARKIATKASMYLQGPNESEIIAVIALLDLYGPDFYPASASSAKDRYDWGVSMFESEVKNFRFRMFFAVHELEAWLLAQPELFPQDVRRALTQHISEPEAVNFQDPPAKLLDKVYKRTTKRGYKKTTYGKQLFARLDPAVAVAKCPRLKEMLEAMLSMAKQAGL